MSHTPGPWRLELYNRDIDVQYQPSRIVAADGTRIMQFDTANHDANARLIAAAPELLEACKKALKSEGPEVDAELEAAIRKAEGK